MKRMRAMIAVLAVLGLVIFTVGPAVAAIEGPYLVGPFIVYFHGVEHIPLPEPGTSTWYYSVESTVGQNAISHFLAEWDLVDCCQVNEAGVWVLGPTGYVLTPWPSGPDEDAEGTVKLGYDGNTGFTGIKFNHEFEEGEVFQFYFTLAQSMPLAIDPAGLSIVVKAGTDPTAALSGGGFNGASGLVKAPMGVQSVNAQQEGGVYTASIPGPDFDVCDYTTAVTLKSFSAQAAGSSFLPSVGMPLALIASLAPISAILALGGRHMWRRR